jgi:hypothetical protein
MDATERGAALIVVMAFIVMLLMLLMAFFSKSTLQQQVSKSSSTGGLVDVFAQGAVDTIVGDLKQEIADGSVVTNVVTTSGTTTVTNTIYYPATNVNAVPKLVGCATNPLLPNLVKISTNLPFYSLTNSNGSLVTGINRATTNSTTIASANGRSISADRWNKPLLLPRSGTAVGGVIPRSQGSTNTTPDTNFVAPSWILVNRAGSNPTTTNGISWSATNPTTVIGRYAYTIYNEGGVLDLSVAGYPLPAVAGTAANYITTNAAYKTALTYADLTQITNGSSFYAMSNGGLLQILAWRNAGSLGTNTNFPAANIINFVQMIAGATNGFMAVQTNETGGNTERAFVSRQQMISFFNSKLSATNNPFAANAIQFLGTFSRALEQPSYAPATNRPPTQSDSGGNNYGSNSLANADNIINPSFLTIRVTNSFTRIDGTIAQVGEPLVKKRFPLNRLAWLTYKGPSASNMSDTNVLATIAAMGGKTNDVNDPIYKFMSKGTSSNIYASFGLSWIQDPVHAGSYEWVYSHPGTNAGTTPVSSIPTTPLPICKLGDIVGREPDFFELLKASITLGSLGKSYNATNNGGLIGTVGTFNATRDNTVDVQIWQIGANIIAQTKPDLFPPRILFNNALQAAVAGGSSTNEVRGVEDLPYLYRIREGKLLMSNPTITVGATTYSYTNGLPMYVTNAGVTTNSLAATLNSGAGVVLQEADIWNPYVATPDTSARPTKFRIIALTCTPSHLSDAVTTNDTDKQPISMQAQWAPYFGSTAIGNPPPATSPTNMSCNDSELDFDIPLGNNSILFREPTMMIKPGIPTGCNLRIGTNGNIISALTGGANYFTSVDTAGSAPAGLTSYPITDDKKYLGFVLGNTNLPMAWVKSLGSNSLSPSTPTNTFPGVVPAEYVTLASGSYITYRLQCLDPYDQWVTYDEKFAPVLITPWGGQWNYSGANCSYYQFSGAQIGGYNKALTAFDPRTRRFGWHYSGRDAIGESRLMCPPNGTGGATWSSSDAAQNIVFSQRPDNSTNSLGGFGYWNNVPPIYMPAAGSDGPTANGWYPNINTACVFYPGLYAQNNPNLVVGAWYSSQALNCFADPDGVVRRGTTAYPQPTASSPMATNSTASCPTGQPMAKAYSASGGTTFGSTFTLSDNGQSTNRPVMLHRPFKSVAELGYVFSDTPWRNLDFFTPESGNSALLDVFTISDSIPADGVVAGKVDLNTRQAPVLACILAGAYKNAYNPTNPVIPTNTLNATALLTSSNIVSRTSVINSASSGAGPIANLSEIVGKYNTSASISGATAPYNIDGGKSYVGFSGIAATIAALSNNPPNLSYVLGLDSNTATGYTTMVVQPYREATVRALSGASQTRIWNLMIDVIAQTGRYPTTATNISSFMVEGEQRYWVHLAIDRLTGQVIDKQVEVVKE